MAGRTRVARAAVTGVVEVPYGRPRSGPGAVTGLALVVGHQLVALPAPLRHAGRFDGDPASTGSGPGCTTSSSRSTPSGARASVDTNDRSPGRR